MTPNSNPHQQEKITFKSFVALQNTPFLAIRPRGVKPPFYACDHDPRLLNLGRALDTEQPFYKMNAHALLQKRLAEGRNIDMSVEEIADYFVREILATQRAGPICLGGGCDGAIIVFEITQQLERLGQEIAMLVIWDTPTSQYWPDEDPEDESIRRILRIRRLFSSGRMGFRRRLNVAINVAKDTFSPAGADQSKPPMNVEQALTKATRSYVANSYPGKIILFKASESDFGCSEPTLGWGAVARLGVDIEVLPGNHFTYFAQNFANFVEKLRMRLEYTQQVVDGKS